jgi:hypothetical protein
MRVKIVRVENGERLNSILRQQWRESQQPEARAAGYFHVTLRGSARSHAIESVTPEEICAQAFVVAVRSANSFVDPEAVRHALFPLNCMHTSTRWPPKLLMVE